MFKEILAFPVIAALSWIGSTVRRTGEVLDLARAYRSLFDRLVGLESAREWRDEHVELVAEYVASSDVEIPETSAEFAEQVETRWRRTEARVSDGETVLAFAVAGTALFAPTWVAAALAGVLFASVSVRLAVVEPLSYTDPDPGHAPARLLAQRAWNEGMIAKSRVARTAVVLRLLREIDPRLYDHYLEEVFVPRLVGSGMSAGEVWDRMTPEATEILAEKLPESAGAKAAVADAKTTAADAWEDAVDRATALRASIAKPDDSASEFEATIGAEDEGGAEPDEVEANEPETSEAEEPEPSAGNFESREPRADDVEASDVGSDEGESEAEEVEVDAGVDVPESYDELDDLSYRELQLIAKEVDVKANLSREEMTERLVNALGIGDDGVPVGAT